MTWDHALKKALMALPVLALLRFHPVAFGADNFCNPSKTNRSCTIVIDRRKPIAPSTIQMYSGEALTVIVKNPFSYERYFLDYSTGTSTIAPDVGSSIAQGLFPALGAVSFGPHDISEFIAEKPKHPEKEIKIYPPCQHPYVAGADKPGQKDLQDAVEPYRVCFADFLEAARQKYLKLEPYAAPDSVAAGPRLPSDLDAATIRNLIGEIDTALREEFDASGILTILLGSKDFKSPVPEDARAVVALTNLQKTADGIASDLVGYRQRLDYLGKLNNFAAACPSSAGGGGLCVVLSSKPDDPHVYQNMVYRTITYSLDSLNLVSNSQDATPDPGKKRALGSIGIIFADTPHADSGGIFSAYRWEASAGVFISTLSNRSYSVQPTYNTDLSIKDNTVHESNNRPTAVPFAAANYRLTDDLGWSQWKSNVYLTFALGVNPNTKTADFAVGPSVDWRAFMLSAILHFGHETKLTQGFAKNKSLGSAFSGSLPTDTKWTTAFAMGVSVRAPSITGR